MYDPSHIVSDQELNIPMKDVTASTGNPRLSNTPESIRETLELPVQRVCWLLRDLGIETTASTANYKNIGEAAGVAINFLTLSDHNKAEFQRLADMAPHGCKISERTSNWGRTHSVTISVPIENGDITAQFISDQFLALIEHIDLRPQIAEWARPDTTEEFFRYYMEQNYGRRVQNNPEIGRYLYDRLMAALEVDSESGQVVIDKDTYHHFVEEYAVIERHVNLGIQDGKVIFDGVMNFEDIMIHSILDEENGLLWWSEDHMTFYTDSVRRATIMSASSVPVVLPQQGPTP